MATRYGTWSRHHPRHYHHRHHPWRLIPQWRRWDEMTGVIDSYTRYRKWVNDGLNGDWIRLKATRCGLDIWSHLPIHSADWLMNLCGFSAAWFMTIDGKFHSTFFLATSVLALALAMAFCICSCSFPWLAFCGCNYYYFQWYCYWDVCHGPLALEETLPS